MSIYTAIVVKPIREYMWNTSEGPYIGIVSPLAPHATSIEFPGGDHHVYMESYFYSLKPGHGYKCMKRLLLVSDQFLAEQQLSQEPHEMTIAHFNMQQLVPSKQVVQMARSAPNVTIPDHPYVLTIRRGNAGCMVEGEPVANPYMIVTTWRRHTEDGSPGEIVATEFY